MTDWSIQKAYQAYNLPHWCGGYFGIDDQGRLVAWPDANTGAAGVSLYQLATEVKDLGLSLPVLVRFTDILRHRVDVLCNAFDEACKVSAYQGGHTAVYPVKANQQRNVVEDIVGYGDDRVGLEAGSKPELLAALALSRQPQGLIICNGYKDREYIHLALIGIALGHQLYIVVEKLSEVDLVIEQARKLGITPHIGVRIRLASLGEGKWQNTGGEKSKFGLSADELLQTVARLRDADLLPTLGMMHFHMGSQIANIRHIQRGMREAACFYAELCTEGVEIRYVNVGGGLSVDYEGTRSRSFFSANYSVQEYANNVVHALWEIANEKGLPHPHIITESGRAMTAHHAVFITNVVAVEQPPHAEPIEPAAEDEPLIIRDMWQALNNISSRSAIESYHDAVYWLAEARSMFSHGVLTLAQRARAEQIYFAICRAAHKQLHAGTRAHREIIDELNEKLADKYFCNFSIFQSVPDVWAIEQIFPIVPLHRLDEPPTRHGVVADITCDSDGRIDSYVNGDGVDATLPLHALKPGEPYLLGIFLTGAYQEILGDMHNLFGDTDSVNVELAPGGYTLTRPMRGDTVDSVLRYVNFEPQDLLAAYKRKIGQVTDLTENQQQEYLAVLEEGLQGYTYLED